MSSHSPPFLSFVSVAFQLAAIQEEINEGDSAGNVGLKRTRSGTVPGGGGGEAPGRKAPAGMSRFATPRYPMFEFRERESNVFHSPYGGDIDDLDFGSQALRPGLSVAGSGLPAVGR